MGPLFSETPMWILVYWVVFGFRDYCLRWYLPVDAMTTCSLQCGSFFGLVTFIFRILYSYTLARKIIRGTTMETMGAAVDGFRSLRLKGSVIAGLRFRGEYGSGFKK